jgi:hypothetical protein
MPQWSVGRDHINEKDRRMSEQELLEKIHTYVHDNYAESYARYALLVTGDGITSTVIHGAAKEAAAWGDMSRYIEQLMEKSDV